MQKTLLYTTLGILSLSSSQAAMIHWEFSNIINGPTALKEVLGTGAIDKSGTLIYAENTGGNAITYDEINFTAGAINMGASSGATVGEFHTSAANISNSGTFGSNNTVTLGNGGVAGDLISGQLYRIQLILMDGRGLFAGRTIEVDGNIEDHSLGVFNESWGDTLLATGTFTADGVSQTFTTEVFDGTTPLGGQLNGFLLHAIPVPEPSSTALLGLGGLGLILRRRK